MKYSQFLSTIFGVGNPYLSQKQEIKVPFRIMKCEVRVRVRDRVMVRVRVRDRDRVMVREG
jgi:hypothetical protein